MLSSNVVLASDIAELVREVNFLPDFRLELGKFNGCFSIFLFKALEILPGS